MGLLPKEKSTPRNKLTDYNIFLYGMPKIGKTTFASHFPDAVFLATEAGHHALSVFKVDLASWEDFLDACSELAEGKHNFRNVVIDTVDNLWMLCRNHICAKNKIEHEADLKYGKGYALILNEFARVLTKLSMLPFGLVLISHVAVQELETRTGTIHKIVPSLPEKPRKMILGMADMILFFDQDIARAEDGKQSIRRVVRTQPSPNYEAGDRTGRLPEIIELDYNKFADAFSAATAEAPLEKSSPKSEQQKEIRQ